MYEVSDNYVRFKHDCNDCIFLGNVEGSDLYFCDKLKPTVIARHSSDGANYSSGLEASFGANPLLTEARFRAQARGLLGYDIYSALRYMPPTPDDEVLDELQLSLPLSAVGAVLMLLATNPEQGKTRVAAFIERYAREHQEACPGADIEDCKDFARSRLLDAYTWLNRLGMPRPSREAFTRTVYA